MSRSAQLPPPVPGPRGGPPPGQLPGFWIASAAIFFANAVLSSLHGQWLAAVLGMITSGVALLAAAAGRAAHRDS